MTRSRTKEIIETDINGIGESGIKPKRHGIVKVPDEFSINNQIPPEPDSTGVTVEDGGLCYEEILDILKNNRVEPALSTPKLYLNNNSRLINIKDVFIKRYLHTVNHYRNIINKQFSMMNVWWNSTATNDVKDLTRFVTIHGILAGSALLCLLTMTRAGDSISLVELIRDSIPLTIIMYLIGGGSLYYLFLDLNKSLHETWGRRRK